MNRNRYQGLFTSINRRLADSLEGMFRSGLERSSRPANVTGGAGHRGGRTLERERRSPLSRCPWTLCPTSCGDMRPTDTSLRGSLNCHTRKQAVIHAHLPHELVAPPQNRSVIELLPMHYACNGIHSIHLLLFGSGYNKGMFA